MLSDVSSVVTASELGVCGCDSVVYTYGETGNSSRVEVVMSVDGVVACVYNPLLPDAVRVGGWLSMVGDTLMCGAVVALNDRGNTGMVVGPAVVQPGWVDGLICADGSLRPSLLQCTQCVCIVCYWLLPVNQDMTIATMCSTGVHIVACMSGTWQLTLSLHLFCVMIVVVAPITTRVCLVGRELPAVSGTLRMQLYVL